MNLSPPKKLLGWNQSFQMFIPDTPGRFWGVKSVPHPQEKLQLQPGAVTGSQAEFTVSYSIKEMLTPREKTVKSFYFWGKVPLLTAHPVASLFPPFFIFIFFFLSWFLLRRGEGQKIGGECCQPARKGKNNPPRDSSLGGAWREIWTLLGFISEHGALGGLDIS